MPISNKSRRNLLSKDRRYFIYKRDHNKCVCCGSTNNLSIDHIKPLSNGGTNDIINLQTMCRKCNSDKGDRL